MDKEREDEDGFNVTTERQQELREAIGDAPIYVLGNLLAQQLLGWPMYLIRNASGQKTYPRFTNHFNPSSVIFDKRHFRQIIASDIGIAILFGVLGTWGYQRGFAEVAKFYLIPYRAFQWPDVPSGVIGGLTCTLLALSLGQPLARLDHVPSAHRPSRPPLLVRCLTARQPRHVVLTSASCLCAQQRHLDVRNGKQSILLVIDGASLTCPAHTFLGRACHH